MMTSTSKTTSPSLRRISIPRLLNRPLLVFISLLIVITSASRQTPPPPQQQQLDDKDDAKTHLGRSKRFAYHTQVAESFSSLLLSTYPFLLVLISLSPLLSPSLSLPFSLSLSLSPSLSPSPSPSFTLSIPSYTLVRAALARHCETTGEWHRPKIVYFEHPDEFTEVEEHVKETVDKPPALNTLHPCYS
jgi:hypothetical protein